MSSFALTIRGERRFNDNMKNEHGIYEVVQRNELAEAMIKRELGGLSLNDRRLFAYALAQLPDLRQLNPEQHSRIRIDVGSWARAYDLEGHGASWDRVQDSAKALQGAFITFQSPFEKGVTVRTGLFIKQRYKEGEGWLEVTFDNEFLGFLAGCDKRFFKYSLEIAGRFSSTYAWKLYEVLKARWGEISPDAKAAKKWQLLKIPAEQVRELLGVEEGQLKLFGDLRRRVLEPAVATVDEETDIEVSLGYEKGGRGGKVIAVVFKYRAKDAAKTQRDAKAKTEGAITLRDRTPEEAAADAAFQRLRSEWADESNSAKYERFQAALKKVGLDPNGWLFQAAQPAKCFELLALLDQGELAL